MLFTYLPLPLPLSTPHSLIPLIPLLILYKGDGGVHILHLPTMVWTKLSHPFAVANTSTLYRAMQLCPAIDNNPRLPEMPYVPVFPQVKRGIFSPRFSSPITDTCFPHTHPSVLGNIDGSCQHTSNCIYSPRTDVEYDSDSCKL